MFVFISLFVNVYLTYWWFRDGISLPVIFTSYHYRHLNNEVFRCFNFPHVIYSDLRRPKVKDFRDTGPLHRRRVNMHQALYNEIHKCLLHISVYCWCSINGYKAANFYTFPRIPHPRTSTVNSIRRELTQKGLVMPSKET